MRSVFLSCVLWLMAVSALLNVAVGQMPGTVSEPVAEGKIAGPTVRQQEWLKASPQERVRMAEELGEEGARQMAKAKGYETLFDGVDRLLPQGPDQVYRAADGRVIVYEAKGGTGQLGHAYGHPQGSPEWAVESAKRVLKSSKAGPAERAAAKEILKAAAEGRLEVHIIRTKHVLGEPTVTVLEGVAKTTDKAMQMARTAIDDLLREGAMAVDDVARSTNVADDATRAADDIAQAAAKGGSKLRILSRAVIPAAVALDVGIRVHDAMETERKFAKGEVTVQQREVEHAKNAAGLVGGWAASVAGAEIGATGGGMVGSMIAPGPGTAVGGAVGGIAGGIAGYFGGEAAAKAAAEWTVSRVHAAGSTISEGASAAWDATTGATKAVANRAASAWRWVWGE